MQKLDGVEAVHVSLQDGLTVLDLKPGNHVTLETLRRVIKNNGFVSKEVHVKAGGEPTTIDGTRAFAVSGTSERLVIAAPLQRAGDLWTFTVPAPR